MATCKAKMVWKVTVYYNLLHILCHAYQAGEQDRKRAQSCFSEITPVKCVAGSLNCLLKAAAAALTDTIKLFGVSPGGSV